jgi:hypothetical protein
MGGKLNGTKYFLTENFNLITDPINEFVMSFHPPILIKNLILLIFISIVSQYFCFGLSFAGATKPGQDSKEAKDLKNGEYASFTPEGDIRRFSGETLYYDIDFMIFSQAATAQISFFEENGKYKSLLTVETRGFVGFITSYVKHVYEATFDIVENGKRLRTLNFEREVIEGEKREKIVHALDHSSLLHSMFFYQNKNLINQFKKPLPLGYQDDVLGAFYNIRNAVYGEVEKGQTFEIPTFWTKFADDKDKVKQPKPMLVRILTDEERKRVDQEEDGGKFTSSNLLVKMLVPSDLYETKNGELYYWASNHLIPTESIYKDFILFGDLHIKFVKREFRPNGNP